VGEADEDAVSAMQTSDMQTSPMSATPEQIKADLSLPAALVGGGDRVEPAAANQGQEGNVSKPEGNRPGSPRKEENEAKIEKKEAKPAVGRGQKSLFDF
jgi:hypothetical protein